MNSQTPSDTHVYNDEYNQTNDPKALTLDYNDTTSCTGQQQVIEQQPEYVNLQPFNYKQNQPNYGQHPRGDLNTSQGQQQLSIVQRQPFIEQYTTIKQPINSRSNTTDSGRCDQSCLAVFVCLCCFWPTGIAAIVYDQKAQDAYKAGNIEADLRTQSDTDVYNAECNQTNDPKTLTLAYNDTPSCTGQQQVIEQQPQYVDLPPLNYRQNPLNYRQQPQGDLNTSRGQQQLTIEQRQPFIAQYPTIEQPMNTRSNTTDSGRSDLSCVAYFVCLCCFWPTGIAAISYAQKAAAAYKNGNIEDGNRYHGITRALIIASVVFGILFGIVYAIIKFNGSPYST